MNSDPLLLGQRVVAILETGLRTATYKLATLMALIEHSIENLPVRPEDKLAVPLPELAHRVSGMCRRFRAVETPIVVLAARRSSAARGVSNKVCRRTDRTLGLAAKPFR